jgi:hypothetical protein
MLPGHQLRVNRVVAPLSGWAARVLNAAPLKTVPQFIVEVPTKLAHAGNL